MTIDSVAWLALVVVFYSAARWVQARLSGHSLANTVLMPAALLLVVFMMVPAARTSFDRAGEILLWFLGPATVALAVPLYTHLERVRRVVLPAFTSLAIGSLTSIGVAVGAARLCSARVETLRSLAPKSVTTPIAMAIAETIGGVPSLAAVFVIVTGSVGALTASSVFDLLRIKDPRARGFALGVAAHGMGTARAFQIDATAGVFATVGMTLNGVLTAIVLPWACNAF